MRHLRIISSVLLFMLILASIQQTSALAAPREGLLAAGIIITVTNTNDSGPGSLRQAILDANANPGQDMIAFNIPGIGPFTISPLAQPGNLTLASTSDTGIKGNDLSSFGTLSADGTKVAFNSVATNLDPIDTDTLSDVYVKDLVTGDIQPRPGRHRHRSRYLCQGPDHRRHYTSLDLG